MSQQELPEGHPLRNQIQEQANALFRGPVENTQDVFDDRASRVYQDTESSSKQILPDFAARVVTDEEIRECLARSREQARMAALFKGRKNALEDEHGLSILRGSLPRVGNAGACVDMRPDPWPYPVVVANPPKGT